MFFLLGQKTTKLALHLFQHIALAVVEPLSRGFALWRERGRRFFRFGHSAPQTRPALQTFRRPCFHFQLSHFTKWLRVSDQKRSCAFDSRSPHGSVPSRA